MESALEHKRLQLPRSEADVWIDQVSCRELVAQFDRKQVVEPMLLEHQVVAPLRLLQCETILHKQTSIDHEMVR